MRFIRSIPPIFRNKFLLAGLAFIAWMLFFDRNDFFAQSERRKELSDLQHSKQYFLKEIEKEKKFSEELRSNPAAIEKIAREKYFMKRDNEELFIVRTPENSEAAQ
jgi:cell division protein DivIC